MCGIRRVLALLALCVGLAHSFSWDMVTAGGTQLNFLNNGTHVHFENIPWAFITSLIYDPVYDRLLFSSLSELQIETMHTIASFDIATKTVKHLVSCKDLTNRKYFKFAYNPPTETLFWIANKTIYSYSLKPECNNIVGGNPVFRFEEFVGTTGIAVDSCKGYIYWNTNDNIQRARFDGSKREVLIEGTGWARSDLVIDQEKQKMYWNEKSYKNNSYHVFIESADLNGDNRKTLFSEVTTTFDESITISKHFIYYSGEGALKVWQLPKDPAHQYLITKTISCSPCNSIVFKYKVEDQTLGNQTCEALTSQDYCLRGDCSLIKEQPTCRCDVGNSSETSKVNGCQDCLKHCSNNGVGVRIVSKIFIITILLSHYNYWLSL